MSEDVRYWSDHESVAIFDGNLMIVTRVSRIFLPRTMGRTIDSFWNILIIDMATRLHDFTRKEVHTAKEPSQNPTAVVMCVFYCPIS